MIGEQGHRAHAKKRNTANEIKGRYAVVMGNHKESKEHTTNNTPYLSVDLEEVRKAYDRLQSYLPDIEIFYAMKCNPNLEIMKTVLECGGQFEISSANELQQAIAAGANPKDIIFSNPIKTLEDIKTTHRLGVDHFAFDSYSEVDKLAEGAPGTKVYVRLAVPVRKSVVVSEGKFGVSIDRARDLMKYAKKRGLDPHGISFHVGSQMLDHEAWGYAIQHCAKLMNILGEDGIHLEFLDIGGGFPVCYEGIETDNLDKAASSIHKALEKHVPNGVRVVVEPGRYLVAKAGTMVSTVIGTAERFGRRWLHLDVGALNGFMESLETLNNLVFPVKDSKQSEDKDIFTLTGPTCDSQDTVLFDVPISSSIKIGDQIYIEYAGAYTTAYVSNFNGFPNPVTYVIDRRKERVLGGKDNELALAGGNRACSPTISYKAYAKLCNSHNDGSRRRGILSPEMYADIVKDVNTGFISIGDGEIPALIDISKGLGMGYDSFRCKEIAKEFSSNIKILALPVHELNKGEKAELAQLITSKNRLALFFSDHNGDEATILAEILDGGGITHTDKPLLDIRASTDNGQAALCLYSCYAEQKLDRGERRKLMLSDVYSYFQDHAEPSYLGDGKTYTTLEMGDRLSDQQAEEMWQIYDDKFDFLGEGHPISMQDTKEDFLKLLRSESTLIAATYAPDESGNKKLACFTYFIDDMDCLYWLNADFLSKNFEAHNNSDYVTNIFTPGLVSSGTGKGYSLLSIGLFAEVSDEAGLSTSVMYENTNLSKMYVPRIVDSTMSNSCKYTDLTPSRQIDEVTYRLWLIGRGDV